MDFSKNDVLRYNLKIGGFSLMEVIVGIAVLSFGLLGTAALLTGVIRSDNLSATMSTATTLGQHEMERVQRLGYSGVTVGSTTRSDAFDNVSYSTETLVVEGTPAAGMRTVTVTVSWNAFGNHSVEFKTILAQ